jgi:hypothetical protein
VPRKIKTPKSKVTVRVHNGGGGGGGGGGEEEEGYSYSMIL